MHNKDIGFEISTDFEVTSMARAALLISFLEVSGNKVGGVFEDNTVLLIKSFYGLWTSDYNVSLKVSIFT